MSTRAADDDDDGLDALIVGAGFTGVYHLHQLRKLGFSVRLFEAGSDIGGAWYWNCYPGARTDVEFPIYQFAMEDLWKDFSFSELFASRDEIIAYLHYVDKKLDLRRDMVFDTSVVSAAFNTDTDRWAVTTDKGVTVHPRFLVLCIGWASAPVVPNYKGLKTFRGPCHHPARWPQGGVEFKNKRVGIIGTGPTGVQVAQEGAKQAADLTVFFRTPPAAFPMRQRRIDEKTQQRWKRDLIPHMLRRRMQTRAGGVSDGSPKSILEVSPEERILTLEEKWDKGGFEFYGGAFRDVHTDKQANEMLCAFWRDKVRRRIDDPVLQEKLAPSTFWFAAGAKPYPCMEQGLYEIFNQSNVHLVDVKENPISDIIPEGVRMSDGTVHELDVLVLATGYDRLGPLKQIDIRGKDGILIRDKWAEQGLLTYLGLMSANYPNMFFPFGPQSPAGLTVATSVIELQGPWIVECLQHMRKNGFSRIEPTRDAEEGWRKLTQDVFSMLLAGQASRSMDGKLAESKHFMGGVAMYGQLCRQSAENGYTGFVLSKMK